MYIMNQDKINVCINVKCLHCKESDKLLYKSTRSFVESTNLQLNLAYTRSLWNFMRNKEIRVLIHHFNNREWQNGFPKTANKFGKRSTEIRAVYLSYSKICVQTVQKFERLRLIPWQNEQNSIIQKQSAEIMV